MGIWARTGHVALLVVAVGIAGCDMKPAEGAGRHARKASKASISTFDASKLEFDIMSVGSERPDEYGINQAFEAAYPGFDECVSKEKQRANSDAQIAGEITLAVRLHPTKGAPMGVNADGPASLLKRKRLVNCMRDAVAASSWPKYDGPPVETEMTIEVDPGFEE